MLPGPVLYMIRERHVILKVALLSRLGVRLQLATHNNAVLPCI